MNVNIYCGSSASRHFTKNRKFSRKSFFKTKVKSRFVYLLFTVCVLSFHYFLSTFILWPYDSCACVFVRLYRLRSCPIANVSSPISQTLHRLARYRNNSLLVDVVGLLHNYTTDLYTQLLSHYTHRRHKRAEKQVQLFSSESHRQRSTSKVDRSGRRCKCEVVEKLFFSSSLY